MTDIRGWLLFYVCVLFVPSVIFVCGENIAVLEKFVCGICQIGHCQLAGIYQVVLDKCEKSRVSQVFMVNRARQITFSSQVL